VDEGHRWIGEKAAVSLTPPRVESALLELNRNWPAHGPSLVESIERFPLGEAALIHLLAVSSVCGTRLAQRPDSLRWLAQPDVCLSPRDRAQMVGELHGLAGDD